MNTALAADGAEEEEETVEDTINRLMEARKMLPNASYFAFTATPKNKTLEIFGAPAPDGGKVRHVPFHDYTMKQAIEEGFILDVLKHYTPVESYYRLMKTVEDDPAFDAARARKKLRRYVESHEHAIRQKAEIMIDHFHEQVIARRKIGGEARAMVATGGVHRTIQYFHAFHAYLEERKSPYRAIVAFSGEHDYGGRSVTEASLNGFPASRIEETIRLDPYRFLIVADKFQTGYDEPLLHTMYVDKILSGIKAVQTLSRLNRAHSRKHDSFVLDFMNDADAIGAAFEDYYRTTILSGETDPDKLHDLKATLDGYQVYAREQVEEVVTLYLGGADRDRLDPILDACVAVYKSDLDEDGQVELKGKAKAFVRTYGFLATILSYGNAEWEKLSIFLNFLTPKLPAPEEQDLSKGILEAIDMDSYRVEAQASMSILLPDVDAEIGPVPMSGGGGKPEPEIDLLSNILKEFNEMFGNVDWKDADKIGKVIAEELPAAVSADRAYRNAMKNSDRQNARIEHDRALGRAVIDLLSDHTELFKQFSDNPSFKKWLSETVFRRLMPRRRDTKGMRNTFEDIKGCGSPEPKLTDAASIPAPVRSGLNYYSSASIATTNSIARTSVPYPIHRWPNSALSGRQSRRRRNASPSLYDHARAPPRFSPLTIARPVSPCSLLSSSETGTRNSSCRSTGSTKSTRRHRSASSPSDSAVSRPPARIRSSTCAPPWRSPWTRRASALQARPE